MARDPSVIAHQFLRNLPPGLRVVPQHRIAVGDAVRGLAALLDGDVIRARSTLARCGFAICQDVDTGTGRPYFLARSGRPADGEGGLFLLDLSVAPSLCVAVPHPDDDPVCVDLAMRLWRAVPGCLLALPPLPRHGGPRHRTDRHAIDPTRDSDSLFHAAWARAMGPRGMTQLQIGRITGRPPRGPAGWAAWGHTGDVDISIGSADLTLPALRISEQVAETCRGVRRSWDASAPEDPTARTNVQSLAAGHHHWAWILLALGPMVRSTTTRWQAVADAVAQADPVTYRLVDHGTPRTGVTLDTSLGDHFLLRLVSDVSICLTDSPDAAPRLLLHLEATDQPHTVRLVTDAVPEPTSGALTITVRPGHPWYGVLRRDGPGRWALVRSVGPPASAEQGLSPRRS
jgi:hypothetical protein